MNSITAYGHTKSTYEWSAIVGMHAATLGSRITAGWSPEDALTMPVDLKFSYKGPKAKPRARSTQLISAFGSSRTADEWSKIVNIKKGTILSRIHVYNMAPEIALSSRRKLRCKGEKGPEKQTKLL